MVQQEAIRFVSQADFRCCVRRPVTLVLLATCLASLPYAVHAHAQSSAPPVVMDTNLSATPASRFRARITRVQSANRSLRVGSACEIRVYRAPRIDSVTRCNVEVVCERQRVYDGASTNGFPCTWREAPTFGVEGSDRDSSSSDGNAAMQLNTLDHVLEIHDDASGALGAFRLRADVDPVLDTIRVRLGNPSVDGRLSPEVVRRVVREHLEDIRACYAEQRALQPELKGRVTVSFVLSRQGRVRNATVAESTLGNTVAESCITTAVRHWVFPAASASVSVSYPFVLDSW